MKENIVIIGGGPAGLEAASELLSLGYTPIIIEKGERLGGHLAQWDTLFPDMAPAAELCTKMVKAVRGANVFLGTEISSINRLKDGYTIILSNGISIQTRIILVATGFKLFQAEKKEEYGYGVYDQVMTNRDLEHWFAGEADKRLDGKEIRSVGFVHCVGSRDMKAGNAQCSKVCCITAIKQAIHLKEKFPDAQVYSFYMDLRMFGKKYEDFYINGQKDHGIHFIRGRVSEVGEDIDGKLIVKAEDTLNGKPLKVKLDLLVLMAGMVCNPASTRLASMMGLPTDTDNFLMSKDNIGSVINAPKAGVFYAGACTGPKTIPETISEARAAALEIHKYALTLK